MEQDWQKMLKEAVIKEIHDRFSLAVYAEEAPQKLKLPCFTVQVTECEWKRLLGRRREVRMQLEIRYYTENRRENRKEALAVAEQLYDSLWLVGSNEKFSAESMAHEETKEGTMVFHVCYVWQVIQEEQEVLMERLEYNGKKVAGYGDDSEI